MTIQQAVAYGRDHLSDIDEHSTIIYSLLSYVLGLPVEHLWAHPHSIIAQVHFDQFAGFVERIKHHEPLAYVLGYVDFYDRRFKVTQDTLIPRPETETIVDKALDFFKHGNPEAEPSFYSEGKTIVDVGTGSGAIAITLAAHLPRAQVYAIDVSPAALEVAQTNITTNRVSNVILLNGSLLEPLQGVVEPHSIDAIVANLPYISDEEYESLPLNIKEYEPALALKSGADPDALNRQLVEQAKNWLKPGGLLLYETTNGQIVTLYSDQI